MSSLSTCSHPLAHPPAPPAGPSLGSAPEWRRDLALVGATSALAASLVTHPGPAFALVAALVAALAGAGLGTLVPWLLHRRVRKKPLVLLLGAGAGLGANWGMLSAGVAALATGEPLERAIVVGGNLGLAQLGWLWLPLALARARGRSTWPLLIAAPPAALGLGALLASALSL